MEIYKQISKKVPDLQLKLTQARMAETPEFYVKKNWMTSIMSTFGILIVLFLFFDSLMIFLLFPILFFMVFSYFMKYVDVKIKKINAGIGGEIVFAGRFLLIELESGVPLYQTFKNLAESYKQIGPYFQAVIDKVDFGTPMEDALNEVILTSPSSNLRKLLWQILNSFKTGSDVTVSLNNVLEQIVREHQIMAKEYGRKLNPLAMFYMMVAIIVPSLGVTLLAVLGSFIGLEINMIVFAVIVILLAFMQFMFLAVIKSSRPPLDI
jgi:archaeal flagellar protein FlaJ